MREYGKLSWSFWTSADLSDIDDASKLLAAYLLTSSHTTLIGAFRLPLSYVSDDMAKPSATVSKGFGELYAKGFCTRHEPSKWVFIHKFIKYNPFENPNVTMKAVKLFDSVPDDLPLKPMLARAMLEFGKYFSEENRTKIETVSKRYTQPYRIPEPEPEPEPEPTFVRSTSLPEAQVGRDQLIDEPILAKPKINGRQAKTPSESAFAQFWALWPSSSRKVARAKCAEKWHRMKLDAKVDVILAHIKAMKGSQQWEEGFEPAPLTYLNQRRWEDGTPVCEKEPESSWV